MQVLPCVERALGGLFFTVIGQAHLSYPAYYIRQVSRRPGNDGDEVSGFQARFFICQMKCEGNASELKVAMTHGFNCFPFIITLGEII